MMATDPTSQGLASRRAALAALKAVDEDDAYSNLAVPDAVGRLADTRDRAFASHLAYETLRWEGTIDWALGTVLTRPLEDVEPALKRVLRLGALQLLHSNVPASAAVSTSVSMAQEAVPAKRAKGAGGFVNGVLRNLSRRLDELPWPDEATDPVAALAMRTAHPAWIVRDLLDRFPVERVKAILEADNTAPGLTLRANGDREAVLAELLEEGLDAEATALAPEGIRVPGGDPRRIKAVGRGTATPQDEASMLVAHAARVKPGDRVLDLCAGPGGKATHLARLAGSDGTVVGIELHPHRAELIRTAARHQGVEVDVRVGDATAPPLAPDELFDVVLLDGPCTGLGTGRRRPEVRWRRRPGDVDELARIQRDMLDAAARHVRPGGYVTFAVCTWTAGETTQVVDDLSVSPTGDLLELVEQRQLWPDEHDTDGMFHATFRRR